MTFRGVLRCFEAVLINSEGSEAFFDVLRCSEIF